MNIILIVLGILFVLFVIIFRKRIIKTLKYYKDNPLNKKSIRKNRIENSITNNL